MNNENMTPNESIRKNPFLAAQKLVELYNIKQNTPEFRTKFFEALENREAFGSYGIIIDSLLREIGLFPYIDDNNISTYAEKIAYNAHKAPEMPGCDVIFHSQQAKVFYALMSGRSVILSAPTSFGKSLIIDAIIATLRFKNIVIVVPTLALIDETRKRLSKFNNLYKIITHPSQEVGKMNVYILTQERIIANDFLDDVDFFVIDEFYKLNPQTNNDDDTRCNLLNKAFYNLHKKCKLFYMLGPNVEGIISSVKESISFEFMFLDYPTVGTVFHKISTEATIENLVSVCESIHDQTLVYCNSPKTANEVATQLAQKRITTSNDKEVNDLCSWIEETYAKGWSLTDNIRHGAGIHHGKLPRALSQYLVDLFNKSKLNYLICTSTLIEGVNTSAKNIIIYDHKVGGNNFDKFTFNNIAGRCGRMFKHFIGHVYMFTDPPQHELPLVDIPIVSQSESASDDVLLGIDRDELSEASLKRLDKYFDESVLSASAIANNCGTNVDMQLAFARAIISSPSNWHKSLCWSGEPTREQNIVLTDVMFNYFGAERLANRIIKKSSHLRAVINSFRYTPRIQTRIKEDYDYFSQNGPVEYDFIISRQLEFQRVWCQFHFPRLAKAIQNIHNDIFSKHNLQLADYSYYITSVESLFLDPVLTALEEYGIPLEVSLKISHLVSTGGDLDRAITALRRADIDKLRLTDFERGFLQRAIPYM